MQWLRTLIYIYMVDHSNVSYAAAVKVIVASTCYLIWNLNEYLLSLLIMYADFINADIIRFASSKC